MRPDLHVLFPSHTHTSFHRGRISWGDGVAQLVEHRLAIQRPEVRTPSGAQETIVRVFPSQNVVLTRCRCAQPLCVYARTRMMNHVRKLKIL